MKKMVFLLFGYLDFVIDFGSDLPFFDKIQKC